MLSLLFFLKLAAAWTFPDGRCYVNDCNVSPYGLTWNSANLNSKNELVACFDINSKTCLDNSKYNCCNSFTQFVNKFIISTNNNCNKSIRSVTSNGIKKAGGVFFDTYDVNGNPNLYSQLRITNLGYNKNITNNTICITVSSPCNSLESFCNGECKFALFNTEHTCCPTCDFNYAPSLAPSSFNSLPPPPPRSPPPPSSPPPSSPPPGPPPPGPPPPGPPPPGPPPPSSPPPSSPPPSSPNPPPPPGPPPPGPPNPPPPPVSPPPGPPPPGPPPPVSPPPGPPPPGPPPPNSPPLDYPPPEPPSPPPPEPPSPDMTLYPLHTCNRDKICESIKQYCLLLC